MTVETFRARRLLRAALAFAVGMLISPGALAQEFRALWVDTFHPALRTSGEVSQLVADARAGNFNAVVVEARKRGDAYYNSNFEPKATDVSPQSFDPLADLVAKAHNTNAGPRIEVHAWIVTYPIWGSQGTPPSQSTHPYNLHPNWLTRNDAGTTWNGSQYVFDQGHPEVQQHTFNVAMDIVSRYDVDGLNFDYVRYHGNTWGYHPVAVARFNALFGRTGQPSPTDPRWLQWRRNQVTALVRKVYLSAIALKPQVKISADTICFAPGVTTDTGWTNSSGAYNSVLQDWRSWMEEGILDLTIPMAYFDQTGQYAKDWTNWNIFTKDHRYNRHAAIGPGIYLNSFSNALLQIGHTRTASPAGNFADGVCGYSYAVPTDDGTSRSAFLAALSQPGGLFASRAAPPVMPWKTTPTKGHVKGFVSAGATSNFLDAATVMLATPVARTQGSDGSGFYGFVDLPPGTYAVTATYAGLGSATSNVTITAGVVSTVNLIISNTDTTPPVIAGVQPTNFTDHSVRIVWHTDEPADSLVEFGLTTNYTAAASEAVLTLSHRLELTGLMEGTTYHFRVRSRDGSGNATVSGDFTFETNPSGVVSDLIIDNPQAAVAGTWTGGTSSADKYGADYRFNSAGSGSEFLDFRPEILVAGTYAVSEWHPAGANRTTNAQHVVRFDGGTQTVGVNQESGGGQWNGLGTFPFAAGTNGCVRITDLFPDTTNNVVVADAIRFSFVPTAPSLVTQPQSLAVNATSNAAFNVIASGSAPLAYQWWFNGAALPGAGASSFTRSNVQPAEAGNYFVVLTNRGGSVTSSIATLAVNTRPVFVVQPQGQSVVVAGTASFTALASGSAPLRFQWRHNGTNVPGATNNSFSRLNVQTSHAGTYTVLASNVAGLTLSTGAVLNVLVPPAILAPPLDLTVRAGGTAVFTVTASGSGPLYYRWQFNGTLLPDGATGATFTRNTVRLADGGLYSVLVTNAAGAVTSAAAQLTVLPPAAPEIVAINLVPAGDVRVTITGDTGSVYAVEGTADFVFWIPLATFTNATGTFHFREGRTNALRCYRVTAP